jgi:hypothetical protein
MVLEEQDREDNGEGDRGNQAADEVAEEEIAVGARDGKDAGLEARVGLHGAELLKVERFSKVQSN